MLYKILKSNTPYSPPPQHQPTCPKVSHQAKQLMICDLSLSVCVYVCFCLWKAPSHVCCQRHVILSIQTNPKMKNMLHVKSNANALLCVSSFGNIHFDERMSSANDVSGQGISTHKHSKIILTHFGIYLIFQS